MSGQGPRKDHRRQDLEDNASAVTSCFICAVSQKRPNFETV